MKSLNFGLKSARGQAALAVLAATLWASSSALAQVPGPVSQAEQANRRIQERLAPDPRVELERGRPVFEDEAGRTPAPVAPGASLPVARVVTTPSELLSPDAVRALVSPYENRVLTVADIQRLVDEIDAAYRAIEFTAGFAVVPDQDLSTGTLNIVLVEPRVDQITASGVRRVDPEFVAARVPVTSGSLFDLARLENNLNLINRTSAGGLNVEALLQPGRSFGTTSVEIAVREAPAFEVTTLVDNYGTREAGRYRPLTIARFNNPLGRDDVFQFGASGALDERFNAGTKGGFASYSVPVYNFTRLNLVGSASQSDIDFGTFAPLALSTRSQFVGGSLRTPLFSSARWLVAGEAGTEFSFSETTTGPLIIDRRIREIFGQADATYYGDTAGFLTSIRLSAFDSDVTTNVASTTDRYFAATGSVFGYKRAGRIEGRVRGNWQWSPDDLLPGSKQFTLGGPLSVRGYQVDQFSGDSGFYVGAEARFLLTDLEQFGAQDRGSLQAVAFADFGGVDPFRADGRSFLREDFASAVGVGVEAAMFRDRLTVFAGVAQPLDGVHRPIHGDDPRLLVQAAWRVPFGKAPSAN